MSGLTPAGFVAKRTPAIKIELEQRLIETFGDPNLNPSSVFGQLVGLTADQQTTFWDELQAVYWSQYPSSAEGVNLDRVASINGIFRLAARPTAVRAVIHGTVGTVLAAGRLASTGQGGAQFALADPVTINVAASVGANIQSASLAAGLRRITVNGVNYDHTPGPDPTAASILNNLADQMPSHIRRQVFDGQGGTALLLEYDTASPISVSGNLTIVRASVYGDFQSVDAAPIPAPIFALNTITTPVAGWHSVLNRSAGTEGRLVETDTELRMRRANSLKLAGRGTLDSIVSNLQQVPGVLASRVVANAGPGTNAEGIPAQHVRAIVDGGTAEDIGRVLFERVAAGIGYYGAQTINVVSEVTGTSYAVKFDRPTNVPIWITVTIARGIDTPADVIERVRDVLMAYAETLSIAETLPYTRLFTPINSAIGEAGSVRTLYIGKAAAPSGVLDLIPGPAERLVLARDRIQINVL